MASYLDGGVAVTATTTSHAIGMSDAAAAARIEEDYAGSRPYQHVLEIIRNATQQHGTTHISSDIVVMPRTGALKRAFINNGPALTESELNSYMTTIGEGDGRDLAAAQHARPASRRRPHRGAALDRPAGPVLGRRTHPGRARDEAVQESRDQRIRVHARVHARP